MTTSMSSEMEGSGECGRHAESPLDPDVLETDPTHRYIKVMLLFESLQVFKSGHTC